MKIGILQTGLLPDSLSARWGQYSDMFAAHLQGRGFETEAWSVVENVFPPGPEAADGWIITGSRHGAYEDHPWIPPLEELVRAIRDSGRPLVGVCFGHQIIAQALGGRVEKYRDGWAVGSHTYQFPGGPKTMNAWHQDQVVEAPKGAKSIASNPFCENAALLYEDRIYSVQAHPEFDDAFTKALIDKRGPGIVPDALLEGARAKLGTPNDREAIWDQFERFFREGSLT